MLSATGYQHNAVLSENSVRQLLQYIEEIEWGTITGNQRVKLSLPAKQFSKILLVTLNHLAGKSSAEPIGKNDFLFMAQNLGNSFIKANSFAEHYSDSNNNSKLTKFGLSNSEKLQFKNLYRLLMSQSYYRSEHNKVSVGDFYLYLSNMKIMQALHSGFDTNQDGLLEMSRDLQNNEFRELLRIADILLGTLSKDEESKNFKSKEEIKKKNISKEILSSPKASLVFSVFADNMAALSVGDGAINPMELALLVENLQNIQNKKDMTRYFVEFMVWPALVLHITYPLSPFRIRNLVFNNSQFNWESGCYFEVLDQSNSKQEFVDNYNDQCGAFYEFDDLEFHFKTFKPFMNRVRLIYTKDKVLSDDELLLSSLMSHWIENVIFMWTDFHCPISSDTEDHLRFLFKNCLKPVSFSKFVSASEKHMGPSTLRLLPPKIRAPLLAANVSPSKVLAHALFKAPELLELARDSKINPEKIINILTGLESDTYKSLDYLELLTNSWAMAQAFVELSSKEP